MATQIEATDQLLGSEAQGRNSKKKRARNRRGRGKDMSKEEQVAYDTLRWGNGGWGAGGPGTTRSETADDVHRDTLPIESTDVPHADAHMTAEMTTAKGLPENTALLSSSTPEPTNTIATMEVEQLDANLPGPLHTVLSSSPNTQSTGTTPSDNTTITNGSMPTRPDTPPSQETIHLRKECSTLRDTNVRLSNDVEHSQKRYSALKFKDSEKSNELAALRTRVTNLGLHNSSFDTKLGTMKNQVARLANESTRLTQELTTKTEAFKAECSSLDVDNTRLKKALALTQGRQAASGVVITGLKTTIADFQSQCDSLVEENSRLARANAALDAQYYASDESHHSQNEKPIALHEKCSNLSGEVARLTQDLIKCQAQVAEQDTEIRGLNEQLAASQNQCSELRSIRDRLESTETEVHCLHTKVYGLELYKQTREQEDKKKRQEELDLVNAGVSDNVKKYLTKVLEYENVRTALEAYIAEATQPKKTMEEISVEEQCKKLTSKKQLLESDIEKLKSVVTMVKTTRQSITPCQPTQGYIRAMWFAFFAILAVSYLYSCPPIAISSNSQSSITQPILAADQPSVLPHITNDYCLKTEDFVAAITCDTTSIPPEDPTDHTVLHIATTFSEDNAAPIAAITSSVLASASTTSLPAASAHGSTALTVHHSAAYLLARSPASQVLEKLTIITAQGLVMWYLDLFMCGEVAIAGFNVVKLHALGL